MIACMSKLEESKPAIVYQAFSAGSLKRSQNMCNESEKGPIAVQLFRARDKHTKVDLHRRCGH